MTERLKYRIDKNGERQPRSLGKLAKRGAAWSTVRGGLSQLIQIPAAAILARLLSPEDFGIAAASWFFTQLAQRMGAFGLAAGIVRSKVVRADHLSSAFALNVIMGVVMWAALTLSAPAVASFYRNDMVAETLPVAALVFLVTPFGTVPMALIQRNLRFRAQAAVEWAFQLSLPLISIPLALAGYGVWSLIWAQFLGSCLRVVMKIALARWRPSIRVSRAALAELAPFGMGVYSKGLLNFAAEEMDSMIIGRTLGLTALGFYDKAFNTATRLRKRLTVGPGVSFRIFAMMQDEPERFRRAFCKVTLSATLVGYPVFLGVAAAAPALIIFLFGEQWRASIVPMQVLCLAGAIRLLNSYVLSASEALGFIWSGVWRNVIYVVSIVLGIWIGSRWGIEGAALAVLAATALQVGLMQDLMRRIGGFSWRTLLSPQVPGIVAGLGTGAVVWVAGRLAALSPMTAAPWSTLLIQAASGATFAALFLLLARFGAMRELVAEVVEDLPGIGRFRRRRVVEPTATT